ncbi:MAG TPA: hypothetical protein PK322_12135 [Opitutaceae bacterium]|nr:hypothetical protein [Opitutaceae bacterium]
MKLTKKTLLVSLAVALPIVLGGGYLFAKKVAWPRYKQYRAASFERSARTLLDQGDFENALLFVRKNLAANQQNVSSWRLAAEIAEKRDDPNALFYLQRLLALDPTLENRMRLLRRALVLRADAVATRTVDQAGAEARDSAEFHELAAQVCLRNGDFIQAKFHLITLCELRPDNRAARLELAQIRLAEAAADRRSEVRAEIRTLAGDPALRARALTLLLTDTMQHKQEGEVGELLALLRREPTLTVAQVVVLAEAMRRYEPDNFPAAVEQLQTLAGTAPADIARVAQYLISIDKAAQAKAWLSAFPAPTSEAVLVQFALAEARITLREWAEVEASLKDRQWKDFDFERLVMIAIAQRERGNLAAFGETWRLSLTQAGTSPARLERLLAHTTRWGWVEQRIEVLWRLFQQTPSDPKVQRQLFAYERAQGNTANLNRLFARLLEAGPGDAVAKNNYAYTALLLGANTARAATLAREIYTADPKNPYYATTHALALLRSGHPDQARTLLAAFDSLQFWQPERLVIQAAVLAANGSHEEADVLLATVDDRRLLPEEKRIAADTRTAIDRHRASTARTSAITETVASRRQATAAKSLLALLPESLRATPSLPMELADSLYASDDYQALAKELGSAPWENRDFVRLALLAYAQRRLDRLGDSRNTWRMAINSVGTRPDLQRVLATLAGTWNWEEERMDLLARILQRDSADQAALDEVAGYYARLHRTTDLARVYEAANRATNATTGNRARFAYYSLLAGINTTEAHVAAKAAFDQNPSDLFAARALALSLWRQGQARASLQILGNPTVRMSPEIDLSLVLALLHDAAGEIDDARKYLAGFSAGDALPEEKLLADTLARKLASSS